MHSREVPCQVRYDRAARRGVCYAAHREGGGHYVRLPVWEMCVLPVAMLALFLCWMLELCLGKE